MGIGSALAWVAFVNMAKNLPFEGEVLRRALGDFDLGEMGTEPVRGRRLGELLICVSCTFVVWVGDVCLEVNPGCFSLDGVIEARLEGEAVDAESEIVDDVEGEVVEKESAAVEGMDDIIVGVVVELYVEGVVDDIVEELVEVNIVVVDAEAV